MKKRFSVLALTAILVAGSAYASGYRIPEQSIDSTAKAGANIASAMGPDASYYNPANMSWMANTWQVEGDLTYIHLTSVNYADDRSALMNGESQKENFLLPTLFVVSPDYNNFHFGLAVTGPDGLSKRWEQPFPRTFSEEYSLKVFDINPTVSYKVCDYFSLAVGPRLLYSDAHVRSNGVVSRTTGYTASRFMEGDTTEFGWNAAVSAKPTKDLNMAVTYRSKVDLDLEGDAILGSNTQPWLVSTGGSVSIPAPAVLSVSAAYTMDKVTVDLTWDRTFWSDYENITFQYDTILYNPVLIGAFGRPIPKNWDDSNAYRIGVSYAVNDAWTVMGGFGIDKTPVPDSTIGFELPDSDAWLYSVGVRYKMNKQMEVGISYLYDYKEDRSVANGTIYGTFSDAAAHLVTMGLTYKF